jgi:multiple sugar transport system substrate-binding protein
MKHFLQAVAAGCTAVAILLGGCNKSESTSPVSAEQAGAEKVVSIWWAQWAPSDGMQTLAEDFTRETGIAVKINQIPWSDYQTQVFLNFANPQTDFDIVVGDSQWMGRCAREHLYLDLSDWLPSAVDLKSIHPVALKYLCEYPPGDPKYFAAPCETDAVGFCYRKDWFEDPKEKQAFKSKYNRELAAPTNWTEFKDVAEFFTRPTEKRYGCAILTGREYDSIVMGLQQFIWAWGGSWGDPKTLKVDGLLNTPGAASGLQFAIGLLKFSPPGGASFSYDKTLEAFKNGSAAMSMDYFAFFPEVAKSMPNQAGFFMLPANNDGKRFISLGGQGMSISTKVSAARQDQAKKFIAWFLKRQTQEKWVKQPAGFTANVEILKSDAFQKATPYNAAFAQSLDHLQDFWSVPSYNDLLAAATRHLGEALDGTKSAQDALIELAKEQEQILKDSETK